MFTILFTSNRGPDLTLRGQLAMLNKFVGVPKAIVLTKDINVAHVNKTLWLCLY